MVWALVDVWAEIKRLAETEIVFPTGIPEKVLPPPKGKKKVRSGRTVLPRSRTALSVTVEPLEGQHRGAETEEEPLVTGGQKKERGGRLARLRPSRAVVPESLEEEETEQK